MENSNSQSFLDKRELIRATIQPTSRGNRFINFIIDSFAAIILAIPIYFLIILIVGISGGNIGAVSEWILDVIYYMLWVSYFIFFEHFTGKTLGKMVTKTKVVTEEGEKPSLKSIIGRSFARLIPLEAFSYLQDNPRGWHDSLSRTMVVDDIPLYDLDGYEKKQFEGEEEFS
jgi:uncharacterized RDD family membrane protein YckC